MTLLFYIVRCGATPGELKISRKIHRQFDMYKVQTTPLDFEILLEIYKSESL